MPGAASAFFGMTPILYLRLAEADRIRYGAQAEREGKALGAWLREAAEEKLARARRGALGTVEELDRFFAACDARETGREPDWREHRAVIERSRSGGSDPDSA